MLALRVALIVSAVGISPASNMASAGSHAFHGEYRLYYPSGAAYQVRHYRHGREEGLQQAWTESGELYLNYEVKDGRRYGFVNSKPCSAVEEGRP
jgi:hypothetical protein